MKWFFAMVITLQGLVMAVVPAQASSWEEFDYYGYIHGTYQHFPHQASVWDLTKVQFNAVGEIADNWELKLKTEYSSRTDATKISELKLTRKVGNWSFYAGRALTPIGYTFPAPETCEFIYSPGIGGLPYNNTGFFVNGEPTEGVDLYAALLNGTNRFAGSYGNFAGRVRFRTKSDIKLSSSVYQGSGRELWATDLYLPFSDSTYTKVAAVWDKGRKQTSGWYVMGSHWLDKHWQLVGQVDAFSGKDSHTVVLGVNYDFNTPTEQATRLMLNLVHDGDDTTVLARFQWAF